MMHRVLWIGVSLTILLGTSGLVVGQVVGPESVIPIDLPILLLDDETALSTVATGVLVLQEDCDSCFVDATQYEILVPEGSERLRIELSNTSDPDADIDLILRYGEPVAESEDEYFYTIRTYGLGGDEELMLPEYEDDVLEPGTYYIGIINLAGSSDQYELRAAAYASVLRPEAIELDPNRMATGTAPAGGVHGDLEAQFHLTIPVGAYLLAVEVAGDSGDVNLHLGEVPVTASASGRISAALHSQSRSWGESIILEDPPPGEFWFAVSNPTAADQPFKLTAAPAPILVDLIAAQTVSGSAGERGGLVSLLEPYLGTEGGALDLKQYRFVVPAGRSEISIRLVPEGDGDLDLHLRVDGAVRVTDGEVVADLSSRSSGGEEIVLKGAFLVEGASLYLGIEVRGEGAVPFELTVQTGEP